MKTLKSIMNYCVAVRKPNCADIQYITQIKSIHEHRKRIKYE